MIEADVASKSGKRILVVLGIAAYTLLAFFFFSTSWDFADAKSDTSREATSATTGVSQSKSASQSLGEVRASSSQASKSTSRSPGIMSFWQNLTSSAGSAGLSPTLLYTSAPPASLVEERLTTSDPLVDSSGADSMNVVEETLTFKRGDSFFENAVRLGLDRTEVADIVNKARAKLDPRRIAIGDLLTLRRMEGNSCWFQLVYEKKNEYRVVVEPEGDGCLVEKEPIALTPKLNVVEGTIESSLYESALEAGLSPFLIQELADIYSWDIDFLVDIRRGDRFRVVYETWYRDGERVKDGAILACRFINDGQTVDAFRYRDEQGREGYYDRQGRNLQKRFLKSPLQYRRISSYFSNRRFHPILKIYRPHHGVDYAAPTGTPVQSIGDGKVTFAGWKRGYGRFIKIRHPNGMISCYGHLSSFAKGLRSGKRVQQGEFIGRVGMTGLATGPHLDFRMSVNGRFVDPLKLLRKSPPLKSLDSSLRQAFNETAEEYSPYLEEGGSFLAQAPTSSRGPRFMP